MPRPSAIDEFTPEQREAFRAECERRNFKDIDGLVVWLKANGMELGRSTAWREASKIKQRIQSLRDATDMSKMIGESVKDEGGSLNDATLSLIQAGLFKLSNTMIDSLNDQADEEATDESMFKNLEFFAKAAKASSELGRASIAVKKYKAEVTARVESAANKVAETAKKNGLSADVVAAIRSEILGVAG